MLLPGDWDSTSSSLREQMGGRVKSYLPDVSNIDLYFMDVTFASRWNEQTRHRQKLIKVKKLKRKKCYFIIHFNEKKKMVKY